MKNLPEVNESFEELYGMLIAPIKSKLLLTGIGVKVFEQLSEPRSAEVVAKTLSAHPVNMRLFLDGLAASDLIIKKNGLYQNTPVTQAFLVEGSPTFLGQMFISMQSQYYSNLNGLSNLVKEGPPPPSPEADIGSEELWVQLAVDMAASERVWLGQQAVEIASGLPEFPSFQKMLDLGGGPGPVSYTHLRAHET